MHLPELPVYEAMSLIKLGKADEAAAILDEYTAKWEAEKVRVDSGFFATTPFFVSYTENAASDRAAYYDRLLNFAYGVKDGTDALMRL